MSGLLSGTGLANLLRDSDTTAIITDYHFADELNALKPQLPAVASERYIATESAKGYQDYRALTKAASQKEPPAIELRDDGSIQHHL